MSWSRTEITSIAQKAARGAGAPAAQAARFGDAAAAHLAAGRDADLLTDALKTLPTGAIITFPLALDAALSDASAGRTAVLEAVAMCPLLKSYVERLPFEAGLDTALDGSVMLSVAFDRPRPPAGSGRITCDTSLIAQLETYAALILVPETAQSRHQGAGAGLTDND